MARKVFFSFHYKPDSWRAGQVRNIGVVEGNSPVSDNDWELITKAGDDKIKEWIAGQLNGKACTIVLIGTNTAGRKWINYEIQESWNRKKGLLGIYIHNLKDKDGNQVTKGGNPFEGFTINNGQTKLSDIVPAYDAPFTTSTLVYDYIKEHINEWVENAISLRLKY